MPYINCYFIIIQVLGYLNTLLVPTCLDKCPLYITPLLFPPPFSLLPSLFSPIPISSFPPLFLLSSLPLPSSLPSLFPPSSPPPCSNRTILSM